MIKNLRTLLAFSIFIALLTGGLVLSLRAQAGSDQSQKKQAQYVAANSKGSAAAPKGTATGVGGASDPVLPNQVSSAYHLGPEDDLAISVWHEPELSQAVTIRPDGMITLPLLNDIKVAGLTTEEAQVLLTEKMKDLVNDPQVTVIVKAIKSQKVYMVGNVAKQGAYALTGQTTLELIAEAGGLGPFAKQGSIYVLRKENGKQTRLPFNYKQALSGKGNNPELKSGDVIVVP